MYSSTSERRMASLRGVMLDKIAIPQVSGHTPGGRMRLKQQALFFQACHLVANRRSAPRQPVLALKLLGGDRRCGADVLLHQRAQDGLLARRQLFAHLLFHLAQTTLADGPPDCSYP